MGVKKIKWGMLVALVLSAAAAHATESGFYLGAQAGNSNIHSQPRTDQTSGLLITPSNTGFGGRLFAGFNVNKYVGFEGGYTYYSPSTYKTPMPPCNAQIREFSYDFLGKGTIPFGTSGIGVFGKAGIAIMNQGVSGCLTAASGTLTCGANNNSTSIRPEIAFGIGYDLTQSWVVDLSFSRVLSGSNIQNADLIALGLSYHWVNERCGQFLC